jgi:competence transcription factor ComK
MKTNKYINNLSAQLNISVESFANQYAALYAAALTYRQD